MRRCHETVRVGWDEWGATDVIASNLAAGRDPESGPSLQRLINAGWRARNRMSDRYALGDLERRLWKVCSTTLRSVVSLGRGDGEVSCQSDPLLEARLGVLLRNLTLTEAICDYDNGELKLQKYEVAKPDWNSAFEGVFERARQAAL